MDSKNQVLEGKGKPLTYDIGSFGTVYDDHMFKSHHHEEFYADFER